MQQVRVMLTGFQYFQYCAGVTTLGTVQPSGTAKRRGLFSQEPPAP